MLTTHARIFSSLLFVLLLSFFILGTQVATTNIAPEAKPPSSQPARALAPLNGSLPDFTRIESTQSRKQQFFNYLIPIVTSVNNSVREERERLLTLQGKRPLNEKERIFLDALSRKYRVNKGEDYNKTFFQELSLKVDAIPPSLVLAQAANESAWGTSRFATLGNNLFGQWCFSKGCGLVPERRNENAVHEVAKYDSVYSSVESYVLNLNRHPQYDLLRTIRYQNRQEKRPVFGTDLATGLESYSERGQAYVDEIQSMIRFNKLTAFDESS